MKQQAIIAALAIIICAGGARPQGATAAQKVVLGAVSQAAQAIAIESNKVAQLARQTALLDYRLNENQRRIRALQHRVLIRRNHLRQRLLALYKLSRGGRLRMLVESESHSEALFRTSGVKRILRRDVDELRSHQRQLRQLGDLRKRLDSLRKRKLAFKRQAETRQQSLEAQQRALLGKLAALKKGEPGRIASEATSERQRRLLAAVTRIKATLTQRTHFVTGHRIHPPVAGRVLRRFGRQVDPSTGAVWQGSGVSFACAAGTPIHPIAAGTVAFAGTVPGYAHMVLVDHGDGYITVYGYLAQVSVSRGQHIERSAVVGRAGSDPQLERPALYFELRRGQEPLDPLAPLP